MDTAITYINESAISEDYDTHNEIEYDGAIALNNIAVKLIEKRCYWHAAETLKNAMTTIKGILNYTSDTTISQSSTSRRKRSFVESQLEKAYRKLNLITTQNAKKIAGKETVAVNLNENINSKNISMALLCLKSALLDGFLSSPKLFFRQEVSIPIRICGKRHIDHAQNGNFDIESTIILYNLAVAYIGMYKMRGLTPSQSSPVSGILQKNAKKVLKMGYSIISSTFDELQNSIEKLDKINAIEETKIVLGVLVLNQLIALQIEAGKQGQQEQQQETMSELFRRNVYLQSFLKERIHILDEERIGASLARAA